MRAAVWLAAALCLLVAAPASGFSRRMGSRRFVVRSPLTSSRHNPVMMLGSMERRESCSNLVSTVATPLPKALLVPTLAALHRGAPIYASKGVAVSNVPGLMSGMVECWSQLRSSLSGLKTDTLLLLSVTSLVVPLFKRFNASPIIGFLLMGTILGPGGLNWIYDLHAIDTAAELGVVFFLFEMGLELSLQRLKAMKRDVFGLGTSQYLGTAAVFSTALWGFGLPLASAVTIGGSLALSSSAFVLQLLKDSNAMGTRHGKASFGILLLQDLAVVPLIVVVQLLSKGELKIVKPLLVAASKAVICTTTMGLFGSRVLSPMFSAVAKASSREAFLAAILGVLLLMSFVTHGIGLSDTLGAFLAGLLLSETSYRYQIESEVSPVRGLLLAMFFIKVGFSIDVGLLWCYPLRVLAALMLLIAGKASIITIASLLFGLPLASAIQTGLLNAQGGEFAFVSLGIANHAGLLSDGLCKLLFTVIALSMAMTPALAVVAERVAGAVSADEDLVSLADDSNKEKTPHVLVCGYGSVGRAVCSVLDRVPVKYVVLENRPDRVLSARKRGLPVFFGDINRPEVLRHLHGGAATACVLTMEDMAATNKAILNLRRQLPALPVVARAINPQHKKRLEGVFSNLEVVAPAPEDDALRIVPLTTAVLRRMGMCVPEAQILLECVRTHAVEED